MGAKNEREIGRVVSIWRMFTLIIKTRVNVQIWILKSEDPFLKDSNNRSFLEKYYYIVPDLAWNLKVHG